jgi:hypothetical protein
MVWELKATTGETGKYAPVHIAQILFIKIR